MIYAPVAQGIEQLPSKQWVAGSNPAGCTKVKRLKYYHGGEKPFTKKGNTQSGGSSPLNTDGT